MKRSILSFIALIPLLCFGAANDIRVSQKNATDSAWVDRIFAPASGGAFTNASGFLGAIGAPSSTAVNSYFADPTTNPSFSPNPWTNALQNVRRVDSIAALRLVSVTGLSNVTQISVSGYYAANDGGGGLYVWNSTSVAADNGGTVIQATGVATGRWMLQYTDTLTVKQFGAKGDGVTDDTASIRAAIAAIPDGGTVKFTTCTSSYLVDSANQTEHVFTIVNPVKLVADNGVIMKLKNNSNLSHYSYGCMIFVNSHDVQIDGLTLNVNYANNPIISPNIVGPGGIVLVTGTDGLRVNYVVRNCRVFDSGYISIGVGSNGPSDASHIMDGVILSNNRCETGYQDQMPVSFARNVVMRDNVCVNPGQYAIHAYTNVTNIDIIGGSITHDVAALVGIPTIYAVGVGHNGFVGTVANVTVVGVTVNMAASATCNRLGIVVQGGATNVTVSGNSVYGGTIGILAGWAAVNCSIVGNTMFGQWNNNACLRGLSRCTFTGNTLTSANQVGGVASDSLGCALYVLSDVALPADGNIVTSNNIFKGSLTNKPVNGIFLDTGATYRPTNTVIQDNNLDQASTGDVIANMDGYNKAFCRNNRGYATEAGDYQGLTGSPVVIPHGLVLTPDVITIVPQNGGKTDIHATVDATNITITFTGGGTEAFFWSARTW